MKIPCGGCSSFPWWCSWGLQWESAQNRSARHPKCRHPGLSSPKLQVNVSVENTHEYYSISLLQGRVRTPWDPVNGPFDWSQGIRCGWIFVYLYSYPIWESLGCCCIRHHTKMKQKCGLSSLLLKNNIIFSVIYRVSEQQGRKGRDSFGSLILTSTHNTTQKGGTFLKIF